MEYGLIGGKLTHSHSPYVHKVLCGIDYTLKELTTTELEGFIQKKQYKGINVTIPYKKSVFHYMDEISDTAKRIGAINTIVNRDGKLYGDNTDYYGFLYNADIAGISFENKKVCIIGSGGTSAMVQQATKDRGAYRVDVITHAMLRNGISPDCLKTMAECELLVNTSPCGMSPGTSDAPTSFKMFENVSEYIDAIYNPYNTTMMIEAKKRGVKAINGLRMLVAQAKRSDELFLGKEIDDSVIEKTVKKIRMENLNIVLIGMPASGKSTIGTALAKKLGRKIVDTDVLISTETGKTINQIFSDLGEPAFRALEKKAVKRLEDSHSLIISTGGGAIIDRENYESLLRNGVVVLLDRSLENMKLMDDLRPLVHNVDDVRRIYKDRWGIYSDRADIIADNNSTVENGVEKLLAKLEEFIEKENTERGILQ